MGAAFMAKLSIINGEISYHEFFSEDISSNPDIWYTDETEIVSGAIALYPFRSEEEDNPYKGYMSYAMKS